MPDMKTLTMAGKTYVVCDEIARTAAEEAKKLAETGSGAVASIGVMEIDADGTLKVENQFTSVDPESGELDGYATEGDVTNAVNAHNADTTAHADLRTLANNAATAAAKAQTTANGKASTATYTVSVDPSWTKDSSGYCKTVAVSGILESDNPIADVVLGSDPDANTLYLEAWSCITRITTAANSITLYANGDAPATAFTCQLKAVR